MESYVTHETISMRTGELNRPSESIPGRHTADNLQVEALETGSDIHGAGRCGLVSVPKVVSGKWLHVSDNAQNINTGTSLQLSADTECGKCVRASQTGELRLGFLRVGQRLMTGQHLFSVCFLLEGWLPKIGTY